MIYNIPNLRTAMGERGVGSYNLIAYALIFTILLVTPQNAFASWLDDFEKALKGAAEKISDALKKGEEITYELAVEYFENGNYQFKAENLSLEEILISIHR